VRVTIPDTLIARVYTHASVEYENFRCAQEVLDNPRNIYSGVRQHNYGYWCYTGRPQEWYVRPNVPIKKITIILRIGQKDSEV